MDLVVTKLSSEDWKSFSENAHLICFNETRPLEMERIDYALMAIDKKTDTPVSYITVRECDANTVYWQYGGGFPGTIGLPAFRSYEAFISWTSERYKRIYTQIENTNHRMLKMAMKVGYNIIGVKCFNGSVMLEHLIEF